jgi:tetratricopeptide (TPR) repeat protein
VTGLAGVGKTALVVRAARLAIDAGLFPGGVLMVDLRGYDPPERRVTASTAMASLLGALGVPSQHIPPEQSDRQRLWRSIMAERMATGRRILVVVDNASSAEQVQPLIPGVIGHHVLVTSRHSLADLSGARLFELDVLPPEKAAELLLQELTSVNPDDERIDSDAHAVRKLVAQCGGLPLAVRIVAALLATEGEQPFAELAKFLADEKRRLEELDYDGSLAIRSAFDLSYDHLTNDQARMFRLLALNPGIEVATEAAVALAGVSITDGRRLLGQLRRAHLVMPGTRRHRWRMHDLLRLYAAGQVVDDPERETALIRMFEFYSTATQEAEQHLDRRIPLIDQSNRFADRQEALNWIDIEYSNLVAAVTLAYDVEHYTHVVKIPSSLLNYFMLRVRSNDWVTIHKLAVAAAQHLGDRRREAGALHDLGIGYGRLGRPREALEYYHRSLRIHQEVGNRQGQARVQNSIGIAYRKLDQFDEAQAYYERSLKIQREVHDRHGESMALNNLGILYRINGRLKDSLACHQRSLRIYREVGDRQGEGASLSNLGSTYLRLGHPRRSIRCHEKSLRLRIELDDREGEGITLDYIGDVYHEYLRMDSARLFWKRSLAIFEEMSNTDAKSRCEKLRKKIDALNI